ncbi:MAG: aminoacyl-tRNA hydrolase [Armatimonadetes bacterium]|nr:aminoacyl-tRNA hydrolase [Armatimonadota bacterium]
MWGIIGLGNPGPEYEDTKHNVGFEVVERLARAHGVRLRRPRAAALAGTGEIEGQPVLLAMPLTMMNASGAAVARLCHLHDLRPEDLIVIVDDINLDLGRLRLRRGGSEGGHRGLKSITERLGTRDYPRLRIGVGAPPGGMDARDWVLSPFADQDRPVADEAVERAARAVECVLRDGIEAAMNQFNQ